MLLLTFIIKIHLACSRFLMWPEIQKENPAKSQLASKIHTHSDTTLTTLRFITCYQPTLKTATGTVLFHPLPILSLPHLHTWIHLL